MAQFVAGFLPHVGDWHSGKNEGMDPSPVGKTGAHNAFQDCTSDPKGPNQQFLQANLVRVQASPLIAPNQQNLHAFAGSNPVDSRKGIEAKLVKAFS